MSFDFKRILSVAFVVSVFASMISIQTFANDFTNCGGWYETLYAEWADTNPTQAKVEYKLSNENTFKELIGEDKEFLQRKKDGDVARVDIVGLKKGNYDIKITSSSGTIYEKSGIKVMNYDRSGYAHFNYDEGVGAYKNDGTIKENAKIIYVTNDNKNTVTVSSSDGTEVSGIGNILNSAGATPKVNDKGTVLSNVINTNKGIIKKLAEDGTPLVVRIIGSVSAPNGLTAYNSSDYGGTKGDNGFMARMQSGKDVTIEGIGYDAQINGWGIHYIAQSSAPQFGKSFEVRNIDFFGSPEDAVGMEGQQSGSSLTVPVERCWIHNNTFEPQKISNPAESDKSEGDGCCDFKRGQYFTMDYNKYINAHKTNLIGSSDKSLQYHMTLHHNYYVNCEARGPLARQGNIHMYNNYFKGQTSYVVNPRANAYIFSEYNNYIECKNVMTIKSGGVVKTFNDVIYGCSGKKEGVKVLARDEKVENSNIYGDFETNAQLSYIPNGDYLLDENTSDAMANVLAYAGVMSEKEQSPQDMVSTLIDEENMPNEAVSVPYEISLTSNQIKAGKTIVDNIVYNATKVAKDYITIKKQGVVFKLDETADVTMTVATSSYLPELYDKSGNVYITGNGTATLPAGIYMIQTNTYDSGKADYKESKLVSLKFSKEGTVETTDTTTGEYLTEESTQNTTSLPIEDGCVAMGKFMLNRSTIDEKSAESGEDYVVNNFVFNNITAVEDARIKISNASAIMFETDRKINFTVELGNKKGIAINAEFGEIINEDGTTSKSASSTQTVTFKLTPGSYTLTGLESSNSYITFLELSEVIEENVDENVLLGDINSDGKLTATDVATLSKVLKGKYTLDEKGSKNAKIHKDKENSEEDLKEIIKKVRNKDFKFEAEL